MDPISPRILRAQADAICPPPPLTGHKLARETRILRVALALFTQFGREAITFAAMALALRLPVETLRMHFTDLDELLGEILKRHLAEVGRATASIQAGTPNWAQRRRGKYYDAIHHDGAHTQAHLLFRRELLKLPEDVRDPLIQTHSLLLDGICYPAPYEQSRQMDNPDLSFEQIEATLAPYAHQPPAEPEPAPEPAAPPTLNYLMSPQADDLNALRPQGMGHAWNENEWKKRS